MRVLYLNVVTTAVITLVVRHKLLSYLSIYLECFVSSSFPTFLTTILFQSEFIYVFYGTVTSRKMFFFSIFSRRLLPHCDCCCLYLNTIGTTTTTNRVWSFAVWAKRLVNPCIIQRCSVGVADLAMVIGGWLADGGRWTMTGRVLLAKFCKRRFTPNPLFGSVRIQRRSRWS